MNYIRVNKVYCLNENYHFPRCHVCKNELSPFAITSEELNKCSWELNEFLATRHLIYLNKIDKDRHLIWLCKHCLKGEIIQDD